MNPTDPRILKTLHDKRGGDFFGPSTPRTSTCQSSGGIIRCLKKQSKVSYPMELDDELIQQQSSNPLNQLNMSPSSRRHSSRVYDESWISEWSFITDLYRVLEHALTRFRGDSNRTGEVFHHVPPPCKALKASPPLPQV
ncbi:uncharacterized protein G6M90_00g113370 [Metarhizium brunneum]|uniref:Uncharacterized protein n=1 Tax=Metarhizium brunneum TaxID=500148 RepID=A0A7D5V6X8_9HYPO|nr:hypothetical protein G6M90_00g113370 [Metarhizium brunneum]